MDRDVFRLIILIIGLMIMAGIYYFDPGRRQQARGQKSWHEGEESDAYNADVEEYVRAVHKDNEPLDFDQQSEHQQAHEETYDQGQVNQSSTLPDIKRVSKPDVVAAKSVRSAEAQLISALSDAEDFDEEDSQLTSQGDLLSPFNDGLNANVDSELEINAALLEPLADPDPDVVENNVVTEPPSIIMLHLVIDSGTPYQGKDIGGAFAKADLRFGSMDIYHSFDYQLNEEVFSVANIREPGTFPEQMTYFETDGMILFMQPMTLENPLEVYDKMIACGDTLFQELGGQILDDKRQPVTQAYLDQQRQWLAG